MAKLEFIPEYQYKPKEDFTLRRNHLNEWKGTKKIYPYHKEGIAGFGYDPLPMPVIK